MSDKIAIKVDNVSKTFRLPHEKNNSVKGAVLNFYKRKKSYEKQQVLKDISFEIKEGEFFGIVGRNGSGKSTLLKLLAGIYSPTSGITQVNGKLTPFIELGVGFNMELTGRENIFLNGALLGFSRSEMEKMYDDIVEFAELSKFMDQKLKNYSSGMQVRLAFSIAIRAESDILLIDEVLAVGDTSFQRKCFEYFVKLKKNRKTVVLVTHDMGAVERFCDRALVLHKSVSKGIFLPHEAAVVYDELNSQGYEESSGAKDRVRWGTYEAKIENLSIGPKNGINTTIESGENLLIRFNISHKKAPKKVVIGLAIFNQTGVNIAGPNSLGSVLSSGKSTTILLKNVNFNPDIYTITLILFDENTVTEYDHIESAAKFEVTAKDKQRYGLVNIDVDWRQNEE